MNNHALSLIQRLYALLLYLYPAGFRREFSVEMNEVFFEASQQAQKQGIKFSLAYFLKELFDLPGSLLHQYGLVLFSQESPMTGAVDLPSSSGGLSASLGFSEPSSSWKELLLAGLPFLAIAYTGLTTLLYGLGVVSPESRFLTVLSVVLAVGMFLIALGIFIFAWRKRFPRWSAAWYGFWLIAALMPLGLIENLWDVPQSYYVFVQPFFWGFILLGIAWFLYRVSCQDPIRGILAALPIMGFTWFLHQEFVRDDLEGTITLVSWLLIAISAVAILRLNKLKSGVLLALGINVVIGLAYAYEGIYFGGTLNFDAPGPNAIQVLRSFLPHWVSISTLVIAPLLARQYRELGYRLQPAGLWLYRLVLFGLLLILIANVVGTFIYVTDSLRHYLRNEDQVLNGLSWAGFAAFIIGFILLSRKAALSKAFDKQWQLWLLGFFSLLMPFGLILGLPHRLFVPSFSLSHDLQFWFNSYSPIGQFPEFWSVVLGVLWTLLAAWLVLVLHSSRQLSVKQDRL